MQAQSVQPYILTRSYICDGAAVSDKSFTIRVLNTNTPSLYSETSFITNWECSILYNSLDLNPTYTVVASGSFSALQFKDIVVSGISYTENSIIKFRAWGSGINTAPSAEDNVPIDAINTPTIAPTLSSNTSSLCNSAFAELSAIGTSKSTSYFNWPSGATQTSSTTATISSTGSYSITETNACGTGPSSNIVVINAATTPTAPSVIASSTLLCDGASATLTASGSGGTYTWSNGATGATTSVSSGGSYYVTETNTCGTSPASSSISISTSNTPTVAAITGTTTICPSTTSQLADATADGIWSSLDGSKATITSNGLVSGVSAGTVTIKYAVTNSCGTATAQTTVTVNSGAPTAPTITSPKTLLCNGEAMTITSTSPIAGGNIIWSNGDNGTTTSVSTAASYKAYELNTCGSSPYSNIITTTILSNPSVAAITGNGSVCVGSQTTLSDATSGGTWFTSDASIATISTSGLVTGMSNSSTNLNYSLSNSCGTTTVSKTITVNALPVLAAISGTANICTNNIYTYSNAQSGGSWTVSNSSITAVNSSGQVTTSSFGTSTLQYTYTDGNSCTSSVTKSLTINALPIVNISSSIVGSNVELTGTGATIYNWSSGESTATIDKALNISNTYTVSGTDGNGCVASKSFTVDASPNASSTAITSSLGNTFCTSATTLLTLSAGNGYYWNSGENTITLTTSTTGTHTGYVLYSTNYKVEAANIVLTNYAIPTVTAINSTNSLAYCNGATAPTLTFNGPVTGSTFAWTNDNTTIGVLASGSNSISSFTASNTTNIPITANFSVVPTANGCVGTTYTFTTTVNPTPNLATTNNYAICNIASNPITLTSNVSGATYLWTRSTNTNISNATTSSTTNLINELLNNISKDNTTATYSVVTSANGCSTTSPISVIVHPTVSADQLSTLAYCNGTQPGILTFTGWANNSTYSWTNDNTTIGVLASGTNTIANYVATNLGGDAIQSNIAVVPTANGCTGPTMNFKIIVNPTPNLLTTKTYTICNKATNPIALTSNVNYATFVWTRVSNTNISNSTYSSTSTIIDETLNNIIHDAATAIYTVVTSANSCSTTNTISVLVQPTVNVDQVSDITYCNGATAPTLTFTGWANNSTYTWSNDNKAIGVLLSGTNSITSYTASNTTGDVVQSNIAVVPTANGCTGPTMNFKIIVNPTPNLISTKILSVCDGSYLQYVTKSNVTAPYNVTWAVKKEEGASIEGTPTSGNILSKVFNTTPTIKNLQFTSTNTSLGCAKNDTINVLVVPNPYGSLIATKDILVSGQLDTFKYVTTDTIPRLNTWNLGFGMPSFKSKLDMYTMDYYHNTDTVNTITIGVLNRYGCFSSFEKSISIIGVPVVIPRYDTIPTTLTDKDTWSNTLLPVPYNDHMSFRYHLDQDEEATFSIVSISGFPLYSVKVKLLKGNNKIPIPELWRVAKDIVYTFYCDSKTIHHQQIFYGVNNPVDF